MDSLTKSAIREQAKDTERFYTFFPELIKQQNLHNIKSQKPVPNLTVEKPIKASFNLIVPDEEINITVQKPISIPIVEKPIKASFNLVVPDEEVNINVQNTCTPIEINEYSYDEEYDSENNEKPIAIQEESSSSVEIEIKSKNTKSENKIVNQAPKKPLITFQLLESEMPHFTFATDTKTYIICDRKQKTSYFHAFGSKIQNIVAVASLGKKFILISTDEAKKYSLKFFDSSPLEVNIPNPFSIVTDPIDSNSIFVLTSENSLLYTDCKQLKLIYEGVTAFDVSNSYLMIKSVSIKIFRRNEISDDKIILEVPAIKDHLYYVTNEHLVQFTGNTLILTNIETKIKEKEIMNVKSVTKTSSVAFVTNDSISTLDYTEQYNTQYVIAAFVGKKGKIIVFKYKDDKYSTESISKPKKKSTKKQKSKTKKH